jgi:hypothetical protein
MIWVSGSNSSGALYSYSTTLTSGSYTYRIYGYDGTNYNNTTAVNQPSVSPVSLSFTYDLSSASGKFDFKDWTLSATKVGLTNQYDIDEDNQSAGTPAVNITNTGNVAINVTMYWNASPASGVTVKYNTTFNAPDHGDNSLAIKPSETLIISNLQPTESVDVWLWLDLVDVQAGTNNQIIKIKSSQYE